jgi:Ran GTPase-activating protein (RanGAP) involved in mRNA processing and transport
MAIGPVGNAIYVNQQMASVASEKTALQNRFELQNVAANAMANDKQKEVEEVRPTEENHEVDPDREHQKHESDDEQKRNPKEDEEEEKQSENPDDTIPHLDIKV